MKTPLTPKGIDMKNIFESVSASPRLKRFCASYMLLYFIIMLVVNLTGKLFPFLDSLIIGNVKDLAVYLIEGALLYGLIQGISEKDYRMTRSLSSFTDTNNYVYYLIYAGVKTVYSISFDLISPLTNAEGGIATFGWVLTVAVNIVGFVINFALTRLYFEKILFKSERLDLVKVCRSCFETIKQKPLRIVGAEVMMLIVKYVAVVFGTILVMFMTSMVGTHWAVSFVGSTLVSIQFGALIYSWPVYYLYYKETCEK